MNIVEFEKELKEISENFYVKKIDDEIVFIKNNFNPFVSVAAIQIENQFCFDTNFTEFKKLNISTREQVLAAILRFSGETKEEKLKKRLYTVKIEIEENVFNLVHGGSYGGNLFIFTDEDIEKLKIKNSLDGFIVEEYTGKY